MLLMVATVNTAICVYAICSLWGRLILHYHRFSDPDCELTLIQPVNSLPAADGDLIDGQVSVTLVNPSCSGVVLSSHMYPDL